MPQPLQAPGFQPAAPTRHPKPSKAKIALGAFVFIFVTFGLPAIYIAYLNWRSSNAAHKPANFAKAPAQLGALLEDELGGDAEILKLSISEYDGRVEIWEDGRAVEYRFSYEIHDHRRMSSERHEDCDLKVKDVDWAGAKKAARHAKRKRDVKTEAIDAIDLWCMDGEYRWSIKHNRMRQIEAYSHDGKPQ